MRQWLIDIRKAKEMTQKEVARAAQIAQPSYYEIEAGKSSPRPDTAKRIGKVLGFNWTRFYMDAEEEEA